MKRPKQLMFGIIASWFAFIALDSATNSVSRFSTRNIKGPIQFLYKVTITIRALLLFVMAFLNFMMFMQMPKSHSDSGIVRD